jgi:hypothetical protein
VSPDGGHKAAPSPPQKQNSEHTRQKEVNSTGWLPVVYVDVRIGLTLHSSSCGTRYELNSFSRGNKKCPLEKQKNGKNMAAKKMFCKDTI